MFYILPLHLEMYFQLKKFKTHVSEDFLHVLITFANSLEPDQTQQKYKTLGPIWVLTYVGQFEYIKYTYLLLV